MDRVISFGKYKGKEIKELILTHIGYIMWCLSNVKSFCLTEEEQKIYDAMAIAIVKYKQNMTFPIDEMVSHIKDKKRLTRLETPFIISYSGTTLGKKNDAIVESVLKYQKQSTHYDKDVLFGVHHTFSKMMDSCINDEDNEYLSEHDIFN